MFRFAYFFFIFQINVDENLKMKLDLIQIERFLVVLNLDLKIEKNTKLRSITGSES